MASGSGTAPRPRYRYLDLVTALFVTALLTSNLVASKSAELFGHTIGVGIFVFPLSYVFGDILTEVYGYAESRRVIWLGFASASIAALIFWACDAAPPAEGFAHQDAFHVILGQSPLVLVASLTAYWLGEFCNSYVMARMKVWTRGRWLWSRTIGSTVVGQAIDSAVFYPLAFLLLPMLVGFDEAVWPTALVLTIMVNNYVLKVLLEAALTPVTYAVVAFFKKREGVDVYDSDTDFNPFRVRVDESAANRAAET